ncbi:MAG: SoxR reducing system RseC family protein [Azoarcus sp.]|jgi:sigma-E factor negative regulatory protein RseC|nr:SoxR reducing system RseC family protein [Azoarcus sp.]
MISARAVVVRAGEGKAWVRLLEHHGGCGRCDEPGGCHAPRLEAMFRGSGRTFAVEDPFGLRVDEQVRIVIDDGMPLKAALASYGLGTVLILGGSALGVWLAPAARADLGAVTGLALGIAVMVFILCIRARRRGPSTWRLRVERDEGGNAVAGCMGIGY